METTFGWSPEIPPDHIQIEEKEIGRMAFLSPLNIIYISIHIWACNWIYKSINKFS